MKSSQKQRKLSSFFPSPPSSSSSSKRRTNDALYYNEGSSFSENSSRFQICIICKKSFPKHQLMQHASNCNGDPSTIIGSDGAGVGAGLAMDGGKMNEHLHFNQERFSQCPICNKSIPIHNLNRHAEYCNGDTASPTITTSCDNRVDVGVTEIILNDVPGSKSNSNGDNASKGTNDKSSLVDVKTIEKHPSSSTNQEQLSNEWRNIIQDVKKSSNQQQQSDSSDILSPTSEPLPGLFLFENFITQEEETLIIEYLDDPNGQCHHGWKNATFNGSFLGKRWGVHCNLRDRRVHPEEIPLPSFVVDMIIPKLAKLNCMKNCIPNEANAISYERKKGHYLKSHVDDRQMSLEPIANLSLAGDCFMTFTHEKKYKLKQSTREIPAQYRVMLKRLTLQVLTGSARYDYSHGIANQDLLSDRRISLTMRQSPLTASK